MRSPCQFEKQRDNWNIQCAATRALVSLYTYELDLNGLSADSEFQKRPGKKGRHRRRSSKRPRHVLLGSCVFPILGVSRVDADGGVRKKQSRAYLNSVGYSSVLQDAAVHADQFFYERGN